MKGLIPTWLAAPIGLLYALVLRFPVAGLGAVFIAGILFWGAFNWSLEFTNTESFCISCHEMRKHIFTEYKTSSHYANRTGVRASCPDCHVPRDWVHKVVRKVGATNELYHWLVGSIDTTKKFQDKRRYLAHKVWTQMKATDSRECRNCHRNDFMDGDAQPRKAQLMHALGQTWEMTCIDCHQGIAHSLPKTFDKEHVMDALHDRMEKEKVDCRSCHVNMAAPKAGDEWE